MQVRKRNNKWELRYDTKDHYGKRKQFRKRFNTKHEAERFYINEQNKINEGINLGSVINLEQYLSDWLRYMESNVSPSTISRYNHIVNNNILPYLGHKQLDNITAFDVEDMLDQNKRKGYSQYTIKHIYRCLFTSMKRALRRRMVMFNPVAEVDVPKIIRSETQALPVKAQNALLKQLDADFKVNKKEGELYCWQNKVFFTLCLELGLRRGECAGLKWSDFDFEKNILRLTRSVTIKNNMVNQIFIKGTKTNKPRNIDIDQDTVRTLKNYKAYISKMILEHKLHTLKESDFMFISMNWDNSYPVVSPILWTNRFKSVLSRADIKPYERVNMQTNELELKSWNIHSLRHTHASNLLSDPEVPLKAISNRLGHSTIAVTCDIYGHMMDDLTGGVFQNAMAKLKLKRTELG